MTKKRGEEAEILKEETLPIEEIPLAEEPEVKPPQTQADLEAKLAETMKALSEKEKGFKSLQTLLNERDKRIQELESHPSTVESTKELRALRKDVAMLWDAIASKEEGSEEIKPKSSRLAQLEAEYRDEQQREWNRGLSEFRKIATEINKDAFTAPEFEDARDVFDAAKYDLTKIPKALQKARKIAEQLKETKVSEEPKEKKDIDLDNLPLEVEERIARKYLDKKGATKQDIGGPSSAGHIYSKKDIIAMPIDEYAKIKLDVDKAVREGRITE